MENKIARELAVLTPEQRKLLEIRLKKEGLRSQETIQKYTGNNLGAIEPVGVKDGYPPGCFPVAPAQMRMYILSQMEGAGTSYNMPGMRIIEESIDHPQLERIFHTLIKRHESLRTSFEIVSGELIQRIHPEVVFEIAYFQASETEVNDRIAQFIRPFDVTQAPLIRVGLIELAPERNILIYDLHHIIADGISVEILAREFMCLYEGKALPALRIQYKDYTLWQNEYLKSTPVQKQAEYWLEQLSGQIPFLHWPTDFPRPAALDFTGAGYRFTLSQELTLKLRTLCKQQDVTMFMLLLAAYDLLLSRFTGQTDIIVGVPVAGRNHADLIHLIGMLLNNLALRNNPEPRKKFLDFLGEVKENAVKAYANQDYPFEMLLEKLNLPRDLSRNSLFDTVFDSQNVADPNGAMIPEASGAGEPELIFYEDRTSKFDITIDLYETESAIRFDWMYRTSLFKAATIQYLIEEYIRLLGEIGCNPKRRLQEFPIFSRKGIPGQNRIRPDVDYEEFIPNVAKGTVGARFEAIAAKYPEQWAIKAPRSVSAPCSAPSGVSGYTYHQLNEQANRIGRAILAAGPAPTVALLFGHEPEMVAGMLGAFKSGAIYTPLDPSYPINRLNYMLEDAGVRTIITNQGNLELAELLSKPRECLIINIDTLGPQLSGENLPGIFGPEQAAYIMYTSGSTGKPKGVIQSHRSILHFIGIYTNLLHLNTADRLALFTSYSHAVGVIDILSAILNGATLYPYHLKTEGSIDRLSRWLRDEEITVYHSVPTVYRYWLETVSEGDTFPRLRLVVLGGETLHPRDVELYRRCLDDRCLFVNLFGSSEVLIATAYLMDKRMDFNQPVVPVGYPVEGVSAMIRDAVGEELGVYGTGEIVYRSAYLALGYWGMEEQTRAVFGEGEAPDERQYRSGDLGRFLPAGTLEFLGRKDDQVKIRGFRIEPSEIEQALNDCAGVHKSVVRLWRSAKDENYLAAYYETIGGIQIDVDELREELANRLPDYMVPRVYIYSGKLPLTPNGKIDRMALPKPDENSGGSREYEAPRNELEEKLVMIWQDILGMEKIGVNDNFFELGGHSLKAMTMITRIQEEFQVKITLRQIFQMPRIKSLAQFIEEGAGSSGTASKMDGEISDPSAAETENTAVKVPDPPLFNQVPVGASAKELPVKLQYEITAYLCHSLPLCVILAHERFYPWFWEHFINIYIFEYHPDYFMLEFLEMRAPYKDIIQEVYLGYELLEEITDIIQFVKRKIDQDYYVIIHVDEFYLPEKEAYQKYHFVHHSLVYGYDDGARKLTAIGFDPNHVFTYLKFDYNLFQEGYEKGKLYYQESAPWAKTNAVELLKPIDYQGLYPFSIPKFLQKLDDYLKSTGDAAIVYTFKRDKSNVRFGIKVYDVLQETLQQLKQGIVRIDYRALHLLTEHKKGLFNRFQFISERYGIGGDFPRLIKDYKHLVNLMETGRKIFLNQTAAGAEDFYSSIPGADAFEKLANILDTVRNEEKEILPRISQLLQEQIWG